MAWEKTLESYGVMIEDKLKDYFKNLIREARCYHSFIANLYSSLEEYVLRRGKRLASCATLLTYKGYTGRIDDDILTACVGIEIYRHSILIHDDIIDMDMLRRGRKTVHQIFAESYDNRFGEGVAIFLGNIAYSLASLALIRSGFPEKKIIKSLSLLSREYQEVNESQVLDLLFEYKNVDVEEWHVMASKRAASLFKIAILTGAILGDAPEEDLKKLEEAAVNVGYAFDIQDDIIDTFADEKEYGKPPCRDIMLGKKPLHVIYTLNLAEPEDSEILKALLGKREDLKKEDIRLIREIIKRSGGLEAAKESSRKHAQKARELIMQTGLNSDVKKFFNSLIKYIEESLDWYR